jgi:cytochrome d ubiquinol oxidase subunit I
MAFSGWVATLAGWYVTEIGRQPFIVHGLLRTADVASAVPAPHIALTLALYCTLYLGCWWPMWRWCATWPRSPRPA